MNPIRDSSSTIDGKADGRVGKEVRSPRPFRRSSNVPNVSVETKDPLTGNSPFSLWNTLSLFINPLLPDLNLYPPPPSRIYPSLTICTSLSFLFSLQSLSRFKKPTGRRC